MKQLSSNFLVVLFIMLYKVVLTFESVDEILKCDHSNESYWAVLSCGAVYYAVQGGFNFQSVDEILKCDHSNKTSLAAVSRGNRFFLLFFDRLKFCFFHEFWFWPLLGVK